MEINGIEITFREILASAVIVLAMLILGTVISGSIKQRAMERKQEYTTAIDISSEDRFAYGLRTDVGRAFCYGTLSPWIRYRRIGSAGRICTFTARNSTTICTPAR